MQIEKSLSVKPVDIFVEMDKSNILPALAAMACFGVIIYNAPSIYDFFSRNFFPIKSSSFPKAEIPKMSLPSPKTPLPTLYSIENKEIASKTQDPFSLKEHTCVYKGDLTKEQSVLEKKLLSHQDLIHYIRTPQRKDKKIALSILLTLLGIKPCLIVESYNVSPELKKYYPEKSKT